MDPLDRVFDKIANSVPEYGGAADRTPVMVYLGSAGFIPYGHRMSFREFFDAVQPGEACSVRDYLLIWIMGAVQTPDPGV